MKRTNRVTKLISLILFLFLLVYFGASLIRSAQNPLQTTLAISMQTEDGFFAPGMIIRNESVITVPHPVVTSLVQEGERVSVGMNYLLVYANESDRELSMRRTQLEYEISRLEERLSLDGETDQSAGIDAAIRQGLRKLSLSVQQGELAELEAQTVYLRTLALAGDRTGLQSRLDALRSELTSLRSLSAPVRTIQAESAGTYSTRVDGFEHLTLANVTESSVSALQTLLARRHDPNEISEGAGKLVRGSTWYFAALVPEAEFERLYRRLHGDLPNRVFVSISGIPTSEISMRIRSLSEVQNGYAAAVFESNIALVETLGLRHAEARIIYNTFFGIRVPAEALHWTTLSEDAEVNCANRGDARYCICAALDDCCEECTCETRFSYVFTLTVGMAEQKFVIVTYAGDGYYLVRPDTERTGAGSALREGNTIIIRGGALYDGRFFR